MWLEIMLEYLFPEEEMLEGRSCFFCILWLSAHYHTSGLKLEWDERLSESSKSLHEAWCYQACYPQGWPYWPLSGHLVVLGVGRGCRFRSRDGRPQLLPYGNNTWNNKEHLRVTPSKRNQLLSCDFTKSILTSVHWTSTPVNHTPHPCIWIPAKAVGWFHLDMLYLLSMLWFLTP